MYIDNFKIDRPAGIISFKHPRAPEVVLSDWSSDVRYVTRHAFTMDTQTISQHSIPYHNTPYQNTPDGNTPYHNTLTLFGNFQFFSFIFAQSQQDTHGRISSSFLY